MPLHNEQTAEALLRLFDINTPCAQLDSLSPQKESIQNAINLVKILDKERQGELFPVNPSLKLLQTAYDMGIRLAFAGVDHVHENGYGCGIKVNILQNDKVIKSVNIMDGMGTISPIVALWKNLNVITFGRPRPDYNFHELGAQVLSALSRRRSSHQQFVKQYRNESNKDWIKPSEKADECFYVKKDWNLASLSQDNIKLMEKLIKQSFHAAGYNDVVFTLVPQSMSCMGGGGYSIAGTHYTKNTESLYLRATLSAADANSLDAIDFRNVLNIFMRNKVDVDLSTKPGDQVAKVKYYDVYGSKQKYTKEEMKAAVEKSKPKQEVIPATKPNNVLPEADKLRKELEEQEKFLAQAQSIADISLFKPVSSVAAPSVQAAKEGKGLGL
jgi:hypothetical protein